MFCKLTDLESHLKRNDYIKDYHVLVTVSKVFQNIDKKTLLCVCVFDTNFGNQDDLYDCLPVPTGVGPTSNLFFNIFGPNCTYVISKACLRFGLLTKKLEQLKVFLKIITFKWDFKKELKNIFRLPCLYRKSNFIDKK